MARIAVICPNCNECATAPGGFVGNEDCPRCSNPLFTTRKNESARLNTFNYAQHPTLCRTLDSVTRTH
jgi:hypothetical protein